MWKAWTGASPASGLERVLKLQQANISLAGMERRNHDRGQKLC